MEREDGIVLLKYLNKINQQLAKVNQLTYAKLYHPIRGRQINFKEYPYLIDIYEDTAKEVVVQKSAQCGISEELVDESFYLSDIHNIIGLYCFPNQSQLNSFSHARVETVIKNSPYLTNIIGDVNNVNLKSINNAHLYFRGMRDMAQIISVNADYLILDEVDEIRQDYIPVVLRRLGGSKHKIVRYVSTPTHPNYGINKLYKQGDMRVWMIRCDDCGTWQSLDFFKNVDLTNKIYICKKCKQPIDNLKTGKWVPMYPERKMHSYHISKLFSPRTNVEELIKAYNNVEYRKRFFNFDLGLPYVVEGGKLTNEHLNSVIGDYEIKYNGYKCFMGVDVGTVINVYITEIDDGHLKTIFAGTIDGLDDKDFEELDRYMKIYNVACCVVDALPETRLVKAFAKRHPERVYLAYYPNIKRDVYFIKDKRDGIPVININRSLSFDYMFDDFYMKKISLPKNIVNVPDFYSQMTALTRVTEEDRSHNKVIKYIEQDADHYSHARNYCRVAEKLCEEDMRGFFIPISKKDRHFQGTNNRIF